MEFELIRLVLKLLAPIIVILALGFWAGRRHRADHGNVLLLNVFLMDFALPAALLLATLQTPWRGILLEKPLVLELLLAMWGVYLLIFLVARGLGRTPAAAGVLALTVAVPNFGGLGLPILNGVAGERAGNGIDAVMALACGMMLVAPFCLMLLEAGKADAGDRPRHVRLLGLLWQSFSKPILLAPLAGVLGSAWLARSGRPVPLLLLDILRPLGMASLASALFLTGVLLAAQRLKVTRTVLAATCVKSLLQPALAWVAVVALHIDPPIGRTGILLMAVSGSFTGVLFASRYGVQSVEAEGVLLLSTGALVLTIPLFLALTASMAHP